MKTSLLCFVGFFAWASFAQFDPITQFIEGEYLGRGRYTAMNDRSDYYASHAYFYENQWELSYLSEIGMHYYKLYFAFASSPKGIFSFEMERQTPGPGSGTYRGHGFCGSQQCSLYADLGNGFMYETITFHGNKIYRLGALHSDNSSETIRWEEEMSHVERTSDEFLE